MADEVRVQLAVGQSPHLDQLVPSRRDDHGGRRRRGESHARHPLRVALRIVFPRASHAAERGGGRHKESDEKMKQGIQIRLSLCHHL